MGEKAEHGRLGEKEETTEEAIWMFLAVFSVASVVQAFAFSHTSTTHCATQLPSASRPTRSAV